MDILAHVILGIEAVFLGPEIIAGVPISITVLMVAAGFVLSEARAAMTPPISTKASPLWRTSVKIAAEYRAAFGIGRLPTTAAFA